MFSRAFLAVSPIAIADGPGWRTQHVRASSILFWAAAVQRPPIHLMAKGDTGTGAWPPPKPGREDADVLACARPRPRRAASGLLRRPFPIRRAAREPQGIVVAPAPLGAAIRKRRPLLRQARRAVVVPLEAVDEPLFSAAFTDRWWNSAQRPSRDGLRGYQPAFAGSTLGGAGARVSLWPQAGLSQKRNVPSRFRVFSSR